MINKKVILTIVPSLLILSGCATPPGEFKEEDMDFVEYKIQKPVNIIASKIQEQERKCGGLVKNFGSTWHPSFTNENVKIDLFLRGIAGTKQDWVGGVIDINKITENESLLKVGVVKIYSRPIFGKSKGWIDGTNKLANQIQNDLTITCD